LVAEILVTHRKKWTEKMGQTLELPASVLPAAKFLSHHQGSVEAVGVGAKILKGKSELVVNGCWAVKAPEAG
jgi:hypothetical protein